MLAAPANADMHHADIVAALKKRGTTLTALAEKAGKSSSYLRVALASKPHPAAFLIIARALGIRPHKLRPSMFDKQGRPIRRPRVGKSTSNGRRRQ